MKTKQAASTKKQTIAVKDLKTRKNPKGGGSYIKKPGIAAGGGYVDAPKR